MRTYEVSRDEYQVQLIEAIKPRKRDFWKVLRGKYTPLLQERSILTLAGYDRILKAQWAGPIKEQMSNSSIFLEHLDDSQNQP